MSLKTRKQDAKAAATAGATNARRQARRASTQVAPLAKSARTQVTPLAKSARQAAKEGVYGARVWAAPRVERTGHVLEERVAPKVSAILAATARRVEPAQPKRRRRWPKALAGMAMLGAGMVAAAVLRGRRPPFARKPDSSSEPFMAAGPTSGSQPTDTETADINGQVRTP
jgi:hypothetical protein